MAQAGLNDEKHWQLKISLDCPFKANKIPVLFCVLKAFSGFSSGNRIHTW